MSIDLLVLNHASVDIRISLPWIRDLVENEGMLVNREDDSSEYLRRCSQSLESCQENVMAFGGSGNLAPLISRTGLNVALAFNVGKGDYNGFDLNGRLFCNAMENEGVNLDHVHTHETLSTAITFIDVSNKDTRGGMVYFPNANDDVDFGRFKEAVSKLKPKIVHYMYVGLSKGGDKNKGKDLADFFEWCGSQGIITSVDTHTLTPDTRSTIESGNKISDYELLIPILPTTDIFFISSDESKIIANSLDYLPDCDRENENFYFDFLDFLIRDNLGSRNRPKLFGVTSTQEVSAINSFESEISKPFKVKSKFGKGQVVDLVGAGDSFKAGVFAYICKNIGDFKSGDINWADTVQMGHLFSSRFINSNLNDRYGRIERYDEMCELL